MTSANKLHWTWTMPASFGSGQFNSLHRFVTVNMDTNIAVEADYSEQIASRAASIFNAHEIKEGRPTRYDVRPIPAKLHNKNPRDWQKLLNEGEEVRRARIEAIPKLMKVNYPPEIVVHLSQHLAEHGTLQTVNWAQLHDSFLEKSIGRDERDPPLALSRLLEYSPGVVTHDEQDALCERLSELLNRASQQRAESLQSKSELPPAASRSVGSVARAPARFRP